MLFSDQGMKGLKKNSFTHIGAKSGAAFESTSLKRHLMRQALLNLCRTFAGPNSVVRAIDNMIKDDVKSVLRIGSAHYKGEPANANIAQISHL